MFANIKKYLLLILPAAFFVTGYAQKDDTQQIDLPVVELGKLSERYYSNDTVTFTLKNNTALVLFYSVSLYEKTGDEWVRILDDVYKHSLDLYNARNVKVLDIAEDKQIRFAVNDISEKAGTLYGLCRFGIEVKKSPTDRGEEYLTAPFLID